MVALKDEDGEEVSSSVMKDCELFFRRSRRLGLANDDDDDDDSLVLLVVNSNSEKAIIRRLCCNGSMSLDGDMLLE